MRKYYSKDQRLEIINRYLSGKTITELSSELGISRSTLYRWIDESSDCQKHERKVNMRDFFNLKKKCEQQEKMIEILQNTPCTVDAPLKERCISFFISTEPILSSTSLIHFPRKPTLVKTIRKYIQLSNHIVRIGIVVKK